MLDIDEACKNAIGGYLRVCSSGGMSQDEIDTVKISVDAAARLNYFALAVANALNDNNLMVSEKDSGATEFNDFQRAVRLFVIAAFGLETAKDVQNRAERFCEESIELLQSVGMTKDKITDLVDYVYGREIGEPEKEVGGVMVTLASLCGAAKVDMNKAAKSELDKNWKRIDKLRAKHESRPKDSSLPQPVEKKKIAVFISLDEGNAILETDDLDKKIDGYKKYILDDVKEIHT